MPAPAEDTPTPRVASWPLQQALFARLDTHPATAGVAVVDTRGEEDYPYCAIGPTFGAGRDTKTTRGSNEVVQLDLWARRTDHVKEMQAAVDTALDAPPLDLTAAGFRVLARPTLTEFNVTRDYDDDLGEELRHGVSRYRFMIAALPSS